MISTTQHRGALRDHWLRTTLLVVASLWPAMTNGDDATVRERRHRQHLEQRQEAIDGLQSDLESAAAWCDEHQLPEAANSVRTQMKILSSTARLNPSRFVTPPVSSELTLDEQQWRLQVQHHREERASTLYSLARSSLRAGLPSLAFSLVGDVLRINPDHKDARAVIGQQFFKDPARKEDATYAGEWVSPFEKKMRSGNKAQTLHPRFGWIPTASLSRYEEGLRPWKGDWISAEKESELRRRFENAWEIPSEHFLVRTNVGLEAGAELSADLEVFYDWMQQNFAGFFETPSALQERFENAAQRSSSRAPKPMLVNFYATRDEYQRNVRDQVPANVETNGFYSPSDRASYFFASDDLNLRATHFHEATHQILDCATIEDRRKAARVRGLKLKQKNPPDWQLCESSNFWIIEGLACYLESFAIVDGQVTVGRPDHQRFIVARERAVGIGNEFYLPAQQMFALGKVEFQQYPDLGPLYTQTAGFTHFLMHYEDGLYRDDLITLLVALYRPDPEHVLEEPSLTKIAGVSSDDFDHQYRTHMQNLEAAMIAAPVGSD